MSSPRPLLAVTLAAALGAVSTASHAALTAFTTSASFAAATLASATDAFNLLPIDFIASPSNRTIGPYSYVASAPGGLFGAGSAANPWLSTNLSGATLTFGSFGGGVSAIGGSFFGSDIAGAFLAGQSLTLTATDSVGASLTQTINGATQTSFLGFASTGTLCRWPLASPVPTHSPRSTTSSWRRRRRSPNRRRTPCCWRGSRRSRPSGVGGAAGTCGPAKTRKKQFQAGAKVAPRGCDP